MRRRIRVAAASSLLALGALSLIACGGDDEVVTETATALSKADYIAKGDAICAQKRQQRGQLVSEMQNEMQNAIASGVNSASDAHRVHDISNQAANYVDQLATELQALPKPTGDEQILDTLLSTVSAEATDIRHFADAVDSRDASQIRKFGEAAESDAAKAVAIAQGYGFTVCGQG